MTVFPDIATAPPKSSDLFAAGSGTVARRVPSGVLLADVDTVALAGVGVTRATERMATPATRPSRHSLGRLALGRAAEGMGTLFSRVLIEQYPIFVRN
jgi:hypothetical protein